MLDGILRDKPSFEGVVPHVVVSGNTTDGPIYFARMSSGNQQRSLRERVFSGRAQRRSEHTKTELVPLLTDGSYSNQGDLRSEVEFHPQLPVGAITSESLAVIFPENQPQTQEKQGHPLASYVHNLTARARGLFDVGWFVPATAARTAANFSMVVGSAVPR